MSGGIGSDAARAPEAAARDFPGEGGGFFDALTGAAGSILGGLSGIPGLNLKGGDAASRSGDASSGASQALYNTMNSPFSVGGSGSGSAAMAPTAGAGIIGSIAPWLAIAALAAVIWWRR